LSKLIDDVPWDEICINKSDDLIGAVGQKRAMPLGNSGSFRIAKIRSCTSKTREMRLLWPFAGGLAGQAPQLNEVATRSKTRTSDYPFRWAWGVKSR